MWTELWRVRTNCWTGHQLFYNIHVLQKLQILKTGVNGYQTDKHVHLGGTLRCLKIWWNSILPGMRQRSTCRNLSSLGGSQRNYMTRWKKKILRFYFRERKQKHEQGGAEGEAGSPLNKEPTAGLDPRKPGPRPELNKADAQPNEPPKHLPRLKFSSKNEMAKPDSWKSPLSLAKSNSSFWLRPRSHGENFF